MILGKTSVFQRVVDGQKKLVTRGARFVWRTQIFNFTCSCKQQTRTGRKSSGNSCQNNFCLLSLVFSLNKSAIVATEARFLFFNGYCKIFSLRQEKTALVRAVNSLGFSPEEQRTLFDKTCLRHRKYSRLTKRPHF